MSVSTLEDEPTLIVLPQGSQGGIADVIVIEHVGSGSLFRPNARITESSYSSITIDVDELVRAW